MRWQPGAAFSRHSIVVAGMVSLAACDRTPEQLADQPAVEEAAAPDGTIRGRLSYPSDYLPEDIQVCGRELTSGHVFCDSRREAENGYILQVPAGAYEVWAQTGDWPEVRAFYSEFVRCGLTADCTDHTPIEVPVEAGEETIGVDPGDWYAGS